jgi:kynureninase
VGRLLSPGDPDRVQRISKVQEEMFSGYVHACYRHIMEMYEGTKKEFRTGGFQARIPMFIKQVALNIHASFNQFAILAKVLNLTELRLQLVESVKELENSEAYR